MYLIKMKIYEEPLVEIMVICDFNHHNSDFFLSKKKTTLGPGQLEPVCSDLLHKNKFAPFSFFWPTKGFCIKKSNDFQPFCLRKPVTLLARGLRVGFDGYFFLVLLRNEPLWWKMALIAFTRLFFVHFGKNSGSKKKLRVPEKTQGFVNFHQNSGQKPRFWACFT